MQTRLQQTRKTKKFSTVDLLANSAIASAGAGAAMGAATGLVWPALAAAAVGAVIGYSATNEIPKNDD